MSTIFGLTQRWSQRRLRLAVFASGFRLAEVAGGVAQLLVVRRHRAHRMKPTKRQMMLLRFYAKYESKPLTLFCIARTFWLLWILLLLPVAIGCGFISGGWPTYGWLLIGVSIGAFLRDVNRILSLSRTWAVIHEIIRWERLRELIQSHDKDAAKHSAGANADCPLSLWMV